MQAMPGEGGDFGLSASGQREPSDPGPAEIVECYTHDPSSDAGLAPGRSKSISRPRVALRIDED